MLIWLMIIAIYFQFLLSLMMKFNWIITKTDTEILQSISEILDDNDKMIF